jgi:ATP-binding protein involved in chromosome partitioning
MVSALVDAVRSALATVQDPDLHRDLVSLNMIRDLDVQDGCASFRLVLTTSACPMKQQLEDQCREAALSVDGIQQVELTMDAEKPKNLLGDSVLPDVSQVIAIASGKGGVGKSTITVNLAASLMQAGASVAILDADIYGPSIPLMMGCDEQPLVDDKKMLPPTRHGIPMMSMGFLVPDHQAMIWRGPMLMGALKQFLTDVKWGALDYLLIDLPPGTGDVPMTLAQNCPLTGAVVVTTPQAVALLDVGRGISMFQKLEVPLLGVVENMSTFVCPQCGHAEAIFGEGGGHQMALEENVPFLGAIPLEPAIRSCGDAGTPITIAHPESATAQAFQHAAGELARQASISRAQREGMQA